MEQRPKVGIGVIIVKDDKVLMQKRINAHGDQTWSFPGGHLEFNEQPEEGAVRESLEEFGITIKDPKIVAVTNDVFSKENKHYVTIFVLSESFEGEVSIKEPDKCERWSWFSWENLPQPLFVPIINLLKQNFNPFDKLDSKKYQHYKGNFYEVIGEGRHSETLEEYVVYKALYDSHEFGYGAVWIRPKKMFFEKVIVDGKEVPRFRLVG